MKPRPSPFDAPNGCFPQSYTARLFDQAILQMIKEGIPLSDYEKFMEEQDRKAEEEQEKLSAKEMEVTKSKSRSGVKLVNQRPENAIHGAKKSAASKPEDGPHRNSEGKASDKSEKKQTRLRKKGTLKGSTPRPNSTD
jgi:hypothetical protein